MGISYGLPNDGIVLLEVDNSLDQSLSLNCTLLSGDMATWSGIFS